MIRKIHKDIFTLVGNTPLIDLSDLVERNGRVKLYAKVESFNPGGSVKDRPGLEIILSAKEKRLLTPEKKLLDATSGNMGIAYTLFALGLGFKVTLCVPANASPERIRLLKILGAELIITDPLAGIDGAIEKASELYEKTPELYYYADQYSNPANILAHYKTTGPEIWEQTAYSITHFVAGLGTSGTMMGVGRFLKEKNKEIKLIGVQPDSSLHGIEGLKHMKTAIRPKIYDESLLDEIYFVSTEEAYAMTLKLLKQKRLFVGVSSGAALAVSLRVARSIKEGVVVTLFPDGGFKYMSERFWEE
jgi:cysteine synthase B